MPKTRYYSPQAGEVITVDPSGLHKIECCDCSLVHLFQFKAHDDGTVSFQVWRDNRATAQRRRAEQRQRQQQGATISTANESN